MSEPDFAFDDDQLELRATLQRVLAAHSPEAEVRRVMASASGHDTDLWNLLAAQLGVTGLAVGEEFGGTGRGIVDLTVVFEELGATLACVPYLATVGLAATLLSRVPEDPSARKYLAGIADGSVLATVALADAASDRDGAVQATATGDGWVLDGEVPFVLDAHAADLVLVGAAGDGEASVFAVEAGAAGLDVIPIDVLDPTRRQATVRFTGAPAVLVGEPGTATAHLAAVRDAGAVLLAAEQVGGAQKLLDDVVSYAKERIQFGRPIGSFQAVKHQCADLLLRVESARSAAYYASAALARGDEEAPALANLAKAYCSETYRQAISTAIHRRVVELAF